MPQEEKTIIDSLNTIGPWIISFIALVQVWAIEAYKKFRNGKIEIHELGQIEIGFNSYGPMITFMGTLRSIHKDVFVKNAEITLTRLKDESRHKFNWRAFRQNALFTTSSDSITYDLATGFLLSKTQPFKYGIIFFEEDFISDQRSTLETVQSKWIDYQRKRLDEIKNDPEVNFKDLDLSSVNWSIFDEFWNKPETTQAYTDLDRALYWTAGEYKIELSIEASNPEQTFEKTYKFSLSEKDEENFRLNCLGIIEDICGMRSHYNLAYPKLSSEN